MADDNGTGVAAELRRLLDERTATLTRVAAKLRDTKKAARDLQAERDAAAAERDAARAAAEKAAKESDAGPARAELDRLKGELRTRDHRAVFDRLARERGCPDDALDFVFTSSGYKAETDAPDEAAIGAHLDGAREKPGLARIFAGPESAAPPPGAGQGRRDATPGKWRITTEQLADGAWAMQNAAKLRAARKDGTLEIV